MREWVPVSQLLMNEVVSSCTNPEAQLNLLAESRNIISGPKYLTRRSKRSRLLIWYLIEVFFLALDLGPLLMAPC